MSEPAPARLEPTVLAEVLGASPQGVVVVDGEWSVCYANPAAAALLGSAEELAGRSLWAAFPELTGSLFHGFLLHARSTGTRVTWRGFYAATGRWLVTTAEHVGGLLRIYLVEAGTAAADPVAVAEDPSADRLRFLAEVSEAMISTLDTGLSASRLAELVVPRLADWATVIVLGDDGAPDQFGRAHHDPDRLADLDVYLGGRSRGARDEPVLLSALQSGEPVQVRAIDVDWAEAAVTSEEVASAWRRLDATSCLFVPLRAHGLTFGALSLINCGDRPPHTESEIATAVEVARRGALALDNARLYSRQLQVAETLQRSLLTPPPRPEGLEIAVRYQPAGTQTLVGGDFYDAFPQPDGALLLVIGDVAGHSVEAAAAMSQLRGAVRTIAYDRPGSPAQTLARVDRVLTGLQQDTLATALVAQLGQPDEGTAERPLRWSSAGHPPPLLLGRDGSVELLDSVPERLLGAGPGALRTDHEAVLRPGDTVVLYTDGLLEAGHAGIDEGLARLGGVLAGLAGESVDAVCDGLLGRIVPGRADDDVAILAVRSTAPPATTRR